MAWPTKHWFDTNVLLIRLAAFVALLSIPFKHWPRHVAGVEQIVPLQLATTSHIVSFGLGLGLLYIANQITMRKRNAWYVAATLLASLIAAELLHYRNPLQIALYAASLANLIIDRPQFVVRSDPISLRRGLLTAVGLITVVLLFAGIIFEVIDQRAFGRDLSTGQTITVTYQALVGGTLPAVTHPRHYDYMLLALLRASGAACLVIIGWSLFRPLRLRLQAPASQLREARRLLEMHSTSSEDFFKLWPLDKHYFFYEQAFVAYGVAKNTVLVLDGVSGDPLVFGALRGRFLEFARLNGWAVAVVHADAVEAEAWRLVGLNRVFIGSEAVVNCHEFASATYRSKHFRYVANRAVKDDLRFSVWQPPLSQEQIGRLCQVSDAWLSQGGRREYAFMMAYFDRSYLGQCQVAVLEQTGKLVAYANLIPTFSKELASIDHMRFVPGLSAVSMHYLLRGMLVSLDAAGVRTCNLGLAPLSKIVEQLDKSAGERLLTIIRRFGSRYYSFEGLEQFKGKFQPGWEPRYLVYQGPPTRLVAVASALNSLSAYRPGSDSRQRWRWRLSVIGLAVASGLAYAAFPLAYWLNRPYVWQGLASDLGQPGQPYAWLFNGLDVASAIFAIILAVILLSHYRPFKQRPRYIHWALVCLLVSSVAALVAAVVSLPAGFSASSATFDSVLQPTVLVHGSASFINSAGFVLAAIFWGVQPRRAGPGHRLGKVSLWRLAVAVAILLMSTVGAAAGFIWPASSPAIQRLFIASYLVWIVIFSLGVTKRRSP